MNKSIIIRISVISLILLWIIFSYPNFYPIPELTTKSMQYSLSLLNIDSLAYNKYLVADMNGLNKIFSISWECAGLILYSIFIIGAFMFPKIPMKLRFMSILFIPLLFIANIFRMILSVITAKYINADFSVIFHNSIGQILIFGLAIAIFISWIKASNKYILKYANVY